MFTVEAQVHIEGTNPVETFDALTDPLLLQFWFPYEFAMNPTVGGALLFQREAWDEAAIGVITAMRPAAELCLKFSGALSGRVTMTLAPDRGGVRVTLSHEGAHDPSQPEEVWRGVLTGLKQYLEAQAP